MRSLLVARYPAALVRRRVSIACCGGPDRAGARAGARGRALHRRPADSGPRVSVTTSQPPAPSAPPTATPRRAFGRLERDRPSGGAPRADGRHRRPRTRQAGRTAAQPRGSVRAPVRAFAHRCDTHRSRGSPQARRHLPDPAGIRPAVVSPPPPQPLVTQTWLQSPLDRPKRAASQVLSAMHRNNGRTAIAPDEHVGTLLPDHLAAPAKPTQQLLACHIDDIDVALNCLGR